MTSQLKRYLINLAFGAFGLLYTFGCLELGAYVQKLEDSAEDKRIQEYEVHKGWVCAPYSK